MHVVENVTCLKFRVFSKPNKIKFEGNEVVASTSSKLDLVRKMCGFIFEFMFFTAIIVKRCSALKFKNQSWKVSGRSHLDINQSLFVKTTLKIICYEAKNLRTKVFGYFPISFSFIISVIFSVVFEKVAQNILTVSVQIHISY